MTFLCFPIVTVAEEGNVVNEEIAEQINEQITQQLNAQTAQIQSQSEDLITEYQYGIPEVIPTESIIEYGHIGRDFEKEEKLNEVLLTNGDGTSTLYYFGYPVKYVDEADGVIKDKSNKLHFTIWFCLITILKGGRI